MRWLVIIVIVAAAAWSGWWWLGVQALDRGLDAGIEAAEAKGWRIDYDGRSIRGFPNRFDTSVTEIDVTAPDGSVRWQAPFLQVFALSYRPNHVIAVAPPAQSLELPTGIYDIRSADLRASVIVSASTTPVLRRATLVMDDLAVSGPGAVGTIADGQVAIREAEGTAAYDVAATVAGLVLDGGDSVLPDRIETMNLDAKAQFDRPLMIGAAEEPVLLNLDLGRAEIAWSDVRLAAAGMLEMDHLGRPSGTLTLTVEGWETILATLTDARLVPPEQAPLIEAGLRGMAVDGRVELPLTLIEGRASLGAFPLGLTFGPASAR